MSKYCMSSPKKCNTSWSFSTTTRRNPWRRSSTTSSLVMPPLLSGLTLARGRDPAVARYAFSDSDCPIPLSFSCCLPTGYHLSHRLPPLTAGGILITLLQRLHPSSPPALPTMTPHRLHLKSFNVTPPLSVASTTPLLPPSVRSQSSPPPPMSTGKAS
jgi:hypothetical protein